MEQKLILWLLKFAPFSKLEIETLGQNLGDCGVFFQGEQVERREQDLLDGVTLHCRYRCAVRLRCVSGSALWARFMALQEEILVATLPALGEDVSVRCKEAALLSRDQTGSAVYQMQLEFTYRKRVES